MKFTELNLPKYILEGLEKQGFENPTEIQQKCIPLIMGGEDVIGKSETGSGKTYAYGIPAIINAKTDELGVNILIVCPTRELASQVCDEFRKLTDLKKGCKVSLIVGGNSFDKQLGTLKNPATKIVIGTPGRIMDHLRRKTLKLNKINLIVLDEADEMLNMGFKEDIETILKSTNPEHQTVMFSATMPKPILALTKNFMKNPKLVELSHENDTSKLIKQYYINVENKKEAIQKLLATFKPALSIVFCNTKRMVDQVTKDLNNRGFSALALHGDMRQGARKETMLEFKGGQIGILVATDVAARGIDVKNVDIIFNYDIPLDIEYYIHRIGRTGRAGKTGLAITLVNSKQQRKQIDLICKATNAIIEEYKIQGMAEYSVNKEEEENQASRFNKFRRKPTSWVSANRVKESANRSSEKASVRGKSGTKSFERGKTNNFERSPKRTGEKISERSEFWGRKADKNTKFRENRSERTRFSERKSVAGSLMEERSILSKKGGAGLTRSEDRNVKNKGRFARYSQDDKNKKYMPAGGLERNPKRTGEKMPGRSGFLGKKAEKNTKFRENSPERSEFSKKPKERDNENNKNNGRADKKPARNFFSKERKKPRFDNRKGNGEKYRTKKQYLGV